LTKKNARASFGRVEESSQCGSASSTANTAESLVAKVYLFYDKRFSSSSMMMSSHVYMFTCISSFLHPRASGELYHPTTDLPRTTCSQVHCSVSGNLVQCSSSHWQGKSCKSAPRAARCADATSANAGSRRVARRSLHGRRHRQQHCQRVASQCVAHVIVRLISLSL
jgi:hypothetical protein